MANAPAEDTPTTTPATTTPATTAPVAAQQKVDPWNVQGAVVDGKIQAIDYNKLVEEFGSMRIDDPLLARFEKVTGQRPHRFLRRGIFFSHRFVRMVFLWVWVGVRVDGDPEILEYPNTRR